MHNKNISNIEKFVVSTKSAVFFSAKGVKTSPHFSRWGILIMKLYFAPHCLRRGVKHGSIFIISRFLNTFFSAFYLITSKFFSMEFASLCLLFFLLCKMKRGEEKKVSLHKTRVYFVWQGGRRRTKKGFLHNYFSRSK